jgi:hypothetical protein
VLRVGSKRHHGTSRWPQYDQWPPHAGGRKESHGPQRLNAKFAWAPPNLTSQPGFLRRQVGQQHHAQLAYPQEVRARPSMGRRTGPSEVARLGLLVGPDSSDDYSRHAPHASAGDRNGRRDTSDSSADRASPRGTAVQRAIPRALARCGGKICQQRNHLHHGNAPHKSSIGHPCVKETLLLLRQKENRRDRGSYGHQFASVYSLSQNGNI